VKVRASLRAYARGSSPQKSNSFAQNELKTAYKSPLYKKVNFFSFFWKKKFTYSLKYKILAKKVYF